MRKRPFSRFGLTLPPRPSLEDFIESVARHAGKPIHVQCSPMLRGENPNGLVFPFRSMFLICHGPVSSDVARMAIVGHELGHIVLGHTQTKCINKSGKLMSCQPRGRGADEGPEENDAEGFSFNMLSVIIPSRSENTGLERILHP